MISPSGPTSVVSAPPAAVKERLAGLDAFRGFDILTMVFVNYIAGMKAIPFILRHASAEMDTFTLTESSGSWAGSCTSTCGRSSGRSPKRGASPASSTRRP